VTQSTESRSVSASLETRTSVLPNKLVTHSKITVEHLRQSAVLYIRQSTSQQLRDHQESTQRQYQLTHRLTSLGWNAGQIVVIDEDRGISGTGRQNRPGFRRLLSLITEQKVGIVLGLEMSRLARNSKDWHDLFEVCGIYQVLIADEDGIFETSDPNDRLVLGLKGIISEMELHTMKVRLERGRFNKAERGELFHDVPVGYVKNADGLPELDPDESARETIHTVFRQFELVGSAHGLFHYLIEHGIRLPFRDAAGQLTWRLASKTGVGELIKHPLYAGAYGYGRKKRYVGRNAVASGRKWLPPEQWKVFIKDRFPAYITWEQYEANQQVLRNNDHRADRTGPARSGMALLAGIVFCGSCGRRLSPCYGSNGRGTYLCGRHHTLNMPPCHTAISCRTLDEVVAEKLLESLQPAAAELSLQVIGDETTRRARQETVYLHQVQQARYQVDLAERRYSHVDPANRLVAASLERQWNDALKNLGIAEQQLRDFHSQPSSVLSKSDHQQLLNACRDVSELWKDHAVMKDKKEIVRIVIERVTVHVQANSERVSIAINWSGGFESCHDIIRSVQVYRQLEGYQELTNRALELALEGRRSPAIADILELEGYRSARLKKRISGEMVNELLCRDERCHQQLYRPVLHENHWTSETLARELKIPVKQLKDWVTRGWVDVIQRPFGRTWVLKADAADVDRLRKLTENQRGKGRHPPQELLRTQDKNARKH